MLPRALTAFTAVVIGSALRATRRFFAVTKAALALATATPTLGSVLCVQSYRVENCLLQFSTLREFSGENSRLAIIGHPWPTL